MFCRSLFPNPAPPAAAADAAAAAAVDAAAAAAAAAAADWSADTERKKTILSFVKKNLLHQAFQIK